MNSKKENQSITYGWRERLLGCGVQPNRAATELMKENLLNCVVTVLEYELPLDLGEDVEITPDELY